jgi:hypothetical protein
MLVTTHKNDSVICQNHSLKTCTACGFSDFVSVTASNTIESEYNSVAHTYINKYIHTYIQTERYILKLVFFMTFSCNKVTDQLMDQPVLYGNFVTCSQQPTTGPYPPQTVQLSTHSTTLQPISNPSTLKFNHSQCAE